MPPLYYIVPQFLSHIYIYIYMHYLICLLLPHASRSLRHCPKHAEDPAGLQVFAGDLGVLSLV